MNRRPLCDPAPTLLTRRELLAAMGLGATALALGCGSEQTSPPANTCAAVGGGATITHGPISGGCTASRLRLALRTSAAAKVAFSLVPKAGGAPLTSSCAASEAAQDFMVIVDIEGLEPATEYRVVPLIDETAIDARAIETRTFSPAGAQTAFTFVFGSCCRYDESTTKTSSQGKVFEVAAALSERPWFFAQIGDWTYPDYLYGNKGLDDQKQNFTAHPEVIAASWRRKLIDGYPLRKLLVQVPVMHVWDDHDFAENNAHKDVTGKQSDRMAAFERYMPCYPVPASKLGAWQRFSVGACDFFLLDLRSQRTDIGLAVSETKGADGKPIVVFNPPKGHTILGEEQRAWLLDGLQSSQATWKFVFSPVEFNPAFDEVMDQSFSLGIGYAVEAIGDGWSGYRADRDALLALHTSGKVKNIVILTGDSHYAAMRPRSQECPPIFCASNLDVTQGPVIDALELFIEGFERDEVWPEWTQDGLGENTIGRVRIATGPKAQVVCESWGASGTLLHTMVVDAEV